MRKIVLVLLALLMIPSGAPAAHKHLQKHKQKLNDLAHKKRVKKAAKNAPGAKKSLFHHHK